MRDETLPTAEDLCVLASLTESRHRLVDRARAYVVELDGDHCDSPFAAPMACQTFIGEHGIGTSLTPSGRSASTTALTIAGVDAIVPASPTPFTPNELVVEGVSVRSVVNDGRSTAVGSK